MEIITPCVNFTVVQNFAKNLRFLVGKNTISRIELTFMYVLSSVAECASKKKLTLPLQPPLLRFPGLRDTSRYFLKLFGVV